MRESLSLFVPAYEVAPFLEATLARLPSEFSPDTADLSGTAPAIELRALHLIDDGSRDETAAAMARLAARDPRIRIHRFPENRGYGAVVREGLALCLTDGSDWIGCLHGDGQYPPEALPAMLQALRASDAALIQGSRHAAGTALQGGMPRYKLWAGRALVALENRVFRAQMTDYHSGLLLYRASFLRRLRLEQFGPSFDIDLQLIATARHLGLGLLEHPIPTHYGEERSHLHPIGYGLRVLGVLGRYLRGGFARHVAD
jgi:glycosyltransferase involved in cell wall biosynthesis